MGCPWPSDPVGITDFCERVHDCSLVLQPIAAASALTFVPVAIAILWMARANRQPALSLLAGSALAMAVGTVVQHATGTHAGMLLDHAGMETANVAMALVGLRRLGGFRWGVLLGFGLVALAVVMGLTASFDGVRRALFIGGMVPCALLELALWWRDGSTIAYGWLGAGWVAFLAAVAAWTLDQGALCDPDSLWQFHALWHSLAALGLGAWAMYYRQFAQLRPR